MDDVLGGDDKVLLVSYDATRALQLLQRARRGRLQAEEGLTPEATTDGALRRLVEANQAIGDYDDHDWLVARFADVLDDIIAKTLLGMLQGVCDPTEALYKVAECGVLLGLRAGLHESPPAWLVKLLDYPLD